MRVRIMLAVLWPVLFLMIAATAEAQMSAQKPAVYTYVAQWSVPRAQWGDMAKMQQGSAALLDRLVSDGTLESYGLYETAVHEPKGPTHGNWFQASSMAGIFKALDSGSFKNSILRGISVEVKPGMEQQFHDAFDRIIRPVLEKLTANGAVHAWSYHNEWIVKNPGMVTIVFIANGPEGLDRYIAAINELFDKNPDAVGPLIAATEPGSRRDFLLRVTAMRQK